MGKHTPRSEGVCVCISVWADFGVDANLFIEEVSDCIIVSRERRVFSDYSSDWLHNDSTVQNLKIIVVFVSVLYVTYVRHDIPLIPNFVSGCQMLSFRVMASVSITVQYII